MGKVHGGDMNINLIVILLAALLFFLVFIPSEQSKKNKKKKITELKIATPDKAKGILFGKKGKKIYYSPTECEGHIGVFSASGTGKTAAVGIPTLRSWDGSSFVIDISGDICKNCPDMPDKLIYNPENFDSMPYNLFGAIDLLSNDDKYEALEQLSYLLIPDKEKNDAAKFFADHGRKILTAALIAFYFQGYDFVEICEKIVSSSFIDLFTNIDACQNKIASMQISAFRGTSEKNTSGCKQACDDAIKLFATNHKIKRSVRRPQNGEACITPSCIEDHNIFIIVEDPKLELYAPLLNIITSQFMQYISNRYVTDNSKEILLFLDEFASLKINVTLTLEALRKYRKRKCRVMLLTQNLADLDILYGHDTTRAIVSNFKFKVLLGGLGEPDSQKYFADLIGYKDKVKRSTSRNAKSITTNIASTSEYIISPAELDRQGKDTVLIVMADGDGYLKLKKNFYFKQ